MEKRSIIIYSYNKVWNIENRIYSIQNLTLPVPIKPRELFYFLAVATIVFILSNLFSFLLMVPVILRYVIFPYLATQFLLKKKLDGKAPQKYLIGVVLYYLKRFSYIERFQERIIGAKSEKISLSWYCGYVELANIFLKGLTLYV